MINFCETINQSRDQGTRGLRREDRLRPLLTALAYIYSRRGAVMTKHSKKVISTELDVLLSFWSFDRASVLPKLRFASSALFRPWYSLPLFCVLFSSGLSFARANFRTPGYDYLVGGRWRCQPLTTKYRI